MSTGKESETPKRERRLPGGRKLWWVLVALLLLNWIVASAMSGAEGDARDISYTRFREEVYAGNVAQVTSIGERIEGRLRPSGRAGAETDFETMRPEFADDDLLGLLERNDVVVKADREPEPPVWKTVLVAFGPALVIVGLLALLMRRAIPSGLFRSRAKRYRPTDERTTFEDVAGIEEARDELVEIVDFLRAPERYLRLGAAIPRGVLLSGPPGTGKTLLARAVAGEAGVPFYSLSASEFVEMVVGVGARRVRDLFEQAKQSAPAIIFIDELDAIGRMRGGSLGGAAHDEREQTLNQILTEMDGFSGSEGVIVIAATNRAEILDGALLRPGRFDRRVVVSPPDRAGRARILAVHTRSVPLDPEVELERVAGRTPGMVGAELKNLVNEAALVAARRSGTSLVESDFDEAIERIVLGAERRIAISDLERARTAYHEAGHALLGMLEPGARSGAQGLDRAARAVARLDLPGVRAGPLRLRHRLPPQPHRGRARGARGGGGRVRRRDDGRRGRPRGRDDAGTPDGGPLGHVAPGRARLGAASTLRRTRPPERRQRRPPRPPRSSWTPRSGCSSTSATPPPSSA